MKSREAKRAMRMQEWTDMIIARRQSGMTVRQWCKANGISEDRYYYGQKELRRAAIAQQCSDNESSSDARLATLVKVDMQPESERLNSEHVTLTYGGGTLDIPAGTSAEAIAEILKALRACAV